MYDTVVTVASRLSESSSSRILPVKQISTQAALGREVRVEGFTLGA